MNDRKRPKPVIRNLSQLAQPTSTQVERIAEKFLVGINIRILVYTSHVQPSCAGHVSPRIPCF